MPEEQDERALIERCRSGDDTAFGELVDQHKNLVYGLVYRMVSDRSRVDDLAQEVFLKVHRGLPYFRGEARLSTWIFRIVQNVCAGARSRRPSDVSLDQDDASGRRYEPGAADAAFGDFELRDRLDKAIAQLPEPQRLLIAAHYLNGVQYRSVGGSDEHSARDSQDAPLPSEEAPEGVARHVTCSDVLHLVEAVAAGDLEVDDRLRAHLETCPSCASALASARRLEAALQARPSPPAPAQFTTAVLAKIRHERWRSEERVDRIFNVAIAAAVLLVVGSVLALTNVDGVTGRRRIPLGRAGRDQRSGSRGRRAGGPHLYRCRRAPHVRSRDVVVGGSEDFTVGSGSRVQGSAPRTEHAVPFDGSPAAVGLQPFGRLRKPQRHGATLHRPHVPSDQLAEAVGGL